MDLNEYLLSLKGNTVSVVGLGVSNMPLLKLLIDNGIDTTARDKKTLPEWNGELDGFISRGLKLCLGGGHLDGICEDVVFRSPGLLPNIQAFNAARERGSFVTSEMEVFFDVCPCRITGVTGSDGKTTTTTLIHRILTESGRTARLGGNIGTPLLKDAPSMDKDDTAVLELSSFQLMSMKKSPSVAVITNISPNHLDHHSSMEEYVEAKTNIFTHQDGSGLLVLNYDNPVTRGFAPLACGRVRFFSRVERLGEGLYLDGGDIILRENGVSRRIMSASDIKLPGAHNVENYLAAIAALCDTVPDEAITRVAREFGGVEHRLELVRELNGVSFYNNSISTSPTRTVAGLRCFERNTIILIAGGYDKKLPFEPMIPEVIDRVKHLVLTGPAAGAIERALLSNGAYSAGNPGYTIVEDFDEAVETAASLASPGDVVLLSPTCASFDRFRDFADRGDYFKKIVREL